MHTLHVVVIIYLHFDTVYLPDMHKANYTLDKHLTHRGINTKTTLACSPVIHLPRLLVTGRENTWQSMQQQHYNNCPQPVDLSCPPHGPSACAVHATATPATQSRVVKGE